MMSQIESQEEADHKRPWLVKEKAKGDESSRTSQTPCVYFLLFLCHTQFLTCPDHISQALCWKGRLEAYKEKPRNNKYSLAGIVISLLQRSVFATGKKIIICLSMLLTIFDPKLPLEVYKFQGVFSPYFRRLIQLNFSCWVSCLNKIHVLKNYRKKPAEKISYSK